MTPGEKDPVPKLGPIEAVNRGYNMLAATLLLVVGLGFSEMIFGEPDWPDKIDNTILLLVGLSAAGWYLTGSHRFQRSPVPIVLGGIALLGQIAGFAIEQADPSALGDDFGGLTIYIVTLIALIVLYSANRKYVTS